MTPWATRWIDALNTAARYGFIDRWAADQIDVTPFDAVESVVAVALMETLSAARRQSDVWEIAQHIKPSSWRLVSLVWTQSPALKWLHDSPDVAWQRVAFQQEMLEALAQLREPLPQF